MIRTLKYPSKRAEEFLKRISNRVEEASKKLENYVERIGREVKKRGDEALIEFTYQFDGVLLSKEELKVKEGEIEEAYKKISPKFISIFKLAIERVRSFHSQNLPLSWFEEREEGILRGTLVKPVERVGLYIPGGRGGETPLISTVFMTAIPAKVAGVKKLILVSPPRKDKTLHPALLVSAHLAGVEEIYRIGGPWSIFALAYGTETIPSVEVICGPGNIYVTLAKKLVSSLVGIDLLAGPSEVLIIADESAPAEFALWDMLAQAEHDPLSMSLLITPSQKLIREIQKLLSQALEESPRREIIETSLSKRGALIRVESLEQAFEIANKIAPEHIELLIKEPFKYLSKVEKAGAVFLGAYTPEALGDYIAGPNHVLPTMGLARFASSLSAEKFLKKINFIQYSFEALKRDGEKVIELALLENLPAHSQAVKVRLKAN